MTDQREIMVATAALVFEVALYYWLTSRIQSLKKILGGRLYHYARCFPKSRGVTSHDILLGALKKVEQKNASLAVILVFVAASLVAFSAGGFAAPNADKEKALLILAFLLPLLPLFGATLMGMRQLDCYNLIGRPITRSVLRTDLRLDLLEKEAAFRFAFVSTAILLVVFGLFLIGQLYFVSSSR